MNPNIRNYFIGIVAICIAVLGAVTALADNPRYPDLSLPPLQEVPDVKFDEGSSHLLSCSMMLAEYDIPTLLQRISDADFLTWIEPGSIPWLEKGWNNRRIQDYSHEISAGAILCSA
jgi:hypothetical protein